MRIQKKCPPCPTPAFPFKTRFEKTSTHVLSQQEKMIVSSSTTSKKLPKGLHYDRCFSVVEDNRCVGRSYYQSNKTLHRLMEERQIHSDIKQMNPKRGYGSIHSDIDKKESFRMPYAQSQVKAIQRKVGIKVIEKSGSTLASSYQMKRNNSNGEVISELTPHSLSSHQVKRWCEEEKKIPFKKRRSWYRWKETTMEEKEAMVSKVKAKRTCSQEAYNKDRDCDLKKRTKRSNKLMEGLSCSHVDRKGCRCRQMTLGNALCEHQLWKSRSDEVKTLPFKKRTRVLMGSKDVMVNEVKEKRTCCQEGYNEGRDCDMRKRKKSGNILMEGSKCSHVNGRGWRCCEMTFGGYALCAHHLGQARTKTMRSIVNCSPSISTVDSNNKPKASSFKSLRPQYPPKNKVVSKEETTERNKTRTWTERDGPINLKAHKMP